MSPQVGTVNSSLARAQTEHARIAPAPKPGAKPCTPRSHALRPDSVSPPIARPSVPVSPPPRHLVDGSPETLAAAFALGGLALGADVTVAGAATAARSTASYLARLGAGIVRCVSDPMKTGEHIAEGVVGGAAWAAAAAGVSALADAARTHVNMSHSAPH